MKRARWMLPAALLVLACSPSSGPPQLRQSTSDVLLQEAAAEGALSALDVVSSSDGLRFRVYHDAPSGEAARAVAPELAEGYRRVARLVGFPVARAQWFDVLFTVAPESVRKRSAGDRKWVIPVMPDGGLGNDGWSMLVTMLHEQTHAIQSSARPDRRLPRWFQEGQATWAGLSAARSWKPRLVAVEEERHAAFLRRPQRASLATWGGVRVKKEALLRQVSEDQRETVRQGGNVDGPFSFGPGDFEQDTDAELYRYAAAAALFRRLEADAGRERLVAWFKALWAEPGELTTELLVERAQEVLGQDIRAELGLPLSQ